ncbi:PfkB family carbohydrate kinase [Rubrivirga marina]|uniref:Sugar kinase n=1 Tax=Rubrivirga marina TaxID=1196024 RepID=A0A271J0S8_9BACT|nr:PfkB family carbohydrate kinase [Rubrivirga marina]PAP76970.1 sugar kinase [Rubrivirga marina]
MSILVVGTVAFDTVETPFGRAERILGGSATYASLAARVVDAPVLLNAVVGRDFPDSHVEALSSRGVDVEGLVRDPDGETFFWAGRYHYDLNTRDTLATHLNVLATFEPDLPASYRTPGIVCLGNLDPTVQSSVIDQTDGRGLVVADTMNFWIENTPDALAETLRRVDVLVINDEEARQLSGQPNLVRAARAVREMGPGTVIIKKGEHGALLFCGDDVFSAPAYPLEDVVDPTGAGDTFLGGFAGHLARLGSTDAEAMRQAVVVGSALASFVVEAFGPDRLLSVTAEELDERIDAFRRLSAVPTIVAA